jgi:hypothetical protein
VIVGFLERVVANRDPDGIRWLAGFVKENPDFLRGYGTNYQRIFRRKVGEELRDAPDGPAKSDLQAIAKRLRIRKKSAIGI